MDHKREIIEPSMPDLVKDAFRRDEISTFKLESNGPVLADIVHSNLGPMAAHMPPQPTEASEVQEFGSIFLFSSPSSSNPPRTRAWKRDAYKRRHQNLQFSQASSQTKRKDEQIQDHDVERVMIEKRGRGEGFDGDVVVLLAKPALQARWTQ
ncbi:hypothetical protein SLE2022_162260 [Rubroshorea leprosula]